jgi:formylglycine-generating enzyme required for sulfatase activity
MPEPLSRKDRKREMRFVSDDGIIVERSGGDALSKLWPEKVILFPLADGVSMELIWVDPAKIWAAKYAVTNREYRCFDPAHDSGSLDGQSLNADDQPAVNVSWDHARRYTLWLQEKFGGTLPDGFHFRLPREPEWESYARCEVTTEPVWGERCPEFGNFEVIEQMRIGWGVPRPVRETTQNAWRLHGVGDTIWEWVEDIFDPTMNRRNLRGACWWGHSENDYQILYHRTSTPDRGHPNFGFRVVAGQ